MSRCPTAAVVLASRNRSILLDRCLTALALQTLQPTTIVVVNDASTDDTAEQLARWEADGHLPLVVVNRTNNAGPATARNEGIRLVHTDWVAFTDDDCRPEPNWLEELLNTASHAPADYAGVGGRVLADEEGIIGAYMTQHRILEPPTSCSYLVTANCVYRKAVLDRVGGFDESVRWPGGEDPGLAFKVRAAGYRLGYCEDAVVYHHYRESFFEFARTFFRYGRGCRLVMG
jgi:GT2 family glycosyltransferase